MAKLLTALNFIIFIQGDEQASSTLPPPKHEFHDCLYDSRSCDLKIKEPELFQYLKQKSVSFHLLEKIFSITQVESICQVLIPQISALSPVLIFHLRETTRPILPVITDQCLVLFLHFFTQNSLEQKWVKNKGIGGTA
ncbi:MAG: hypothetical protein BBJ57_02560 [Desulfobacterales bacterium PC51MH44]|nr:MAG: hypothetical protein BBJ57_02560 [Desulfobacterales bacterium PC51MH44]